MHRSVAKAYTQRAQLTIAILVAVGIAVCVWPGQKTEATPIEVPPPPKSEAIAKRAALNAKFADLAQASPHLLDKLAPPPPKPVVEAPKPGDAPPPPPPPPVPTWKYLGVISAPGLLRAVVSNGDKQMLLGIGERLDGAELLEITPERLSLGENGQTRTLEIAPRIKPVLKIVSAAPTSAPGMVPPGQDPALPPGGQPTYRPNSAEDSPDAALEARRQAEAKRAMEDAHKRRTGTPGGRNK